LGFGVGTAAVARSLAALTAASIGAMSSRGGRSFLLHAFLLFVAMAIPFLALGAA